MLSKKGLGMTVGMYTEDEMMMGIDEEEPEIPRG